MAFLNRLFNRKSKTEFVSSPQASLRRSLTDPNPPSNNTAHPKGRRSSSDDKDTVDKLPPSRRAWLRTRRAGCDFGRSKTSIDVGSVRSSTSSAAELNSNSSDGSKSQYRNLRTLHRSRQHTIMAAQNRSTKAIVIMKTFQKARMTTTLRAKLESEVHHLRALAGVPGIVQLINQYEDDDCIYIVLDHCPGTTLIELVANLGGRLSEAHFVLDVLIPLTLVLCNLHRRGIVHRQIKPEHVLCDSQRGVVTLLDFAEAVNMKQRCLNNRAGNLEYMAPEVLNKPTAEEVFHQVLYNGMSEEELPQYDEKADVWSLGALAFEALTGCQPFLADTPLELSLLQRELLTEAGPDGVQRLFAGRPPLSVEARSFMLAAMQLDPINRPSADRLLHHPLLQRYWPKYQARQVALMAAGGSGRLQAVPSAAVMGSGSAATGSGGAATGSGGAVTGSPLTARSATAVAAWDGQVQTAAMVTAATRSAGAGGGAGGCAVPTAVQKPSMLLSAPLQFPVR